jgi:cell division protein FtsQ
MFKDPESQASLKRIAWIGGIFLTVMLLAAAWDRKKEMTIAATDVEIVPLEGGELLIDSADVIKLVERSYGTALDSKLAGEVNVDWLERALEEDLYVKNAEVVLTANSKIKIKIEQREPVLRIIDNMGAQYYLDIDGNRVPLSKHFVATRTLVASGNIPPHTPEFLKKKRHLMKDLFELAQFIRAEEFWAAMIEQIYVNNRDEFVLVPKLGDQAIVLGKYDDSVEDKFRRLMIFYREGMNREGWQEYKTIDLRYRGQVVCERR